MNFFFLINFFYQKRFFFFVEWNTIFTSPNCELPAYDMSNNTLPGGPVMLSTDKCSYKDQYAPVGGVQYWESNIAEGNRSLYVPEVCRVEPGLTVPLEFLSYCTCRDACKQAFSFGTYIHNIEYIFFFGHSVLEMHDYVFFLLLL